MEKQVVALCRAGFRVVAYDRRGFGQSSMPSFGYDFNTLAADLHTLIGVLELRDVTLVGFGMGGGEVARYFGRYGAERVLRAAFVSSITPMLELPDLERMQSQINVDRFAFARGYIGDTYNSDGVSSQNVSRDFLDREAAIAAIASPIAAYESLGAWRTDFRSDLEGVDVPILVLHGDSDRIAPLSETAQRMPAHVRRLTLTILEGAPHGLTWTHAHKSTPHSFTFSRKVLRS